MDLLLAAALVVAITGAALAIAGLVATGPAVLPVGLVITWAAVHLAWGWLPSDASGHPRGRKAGPAADEGRGRGRHPNR